MVIPQGGGDEIPIQLKPGTPGVIYKGLKLLLMVRFGSRLQSNQINSLILQIQLTHTQDGRSGLIPLMHDLRTNHTFAVRNPHQTCMISNVDALLKKVYQEYGRPSEWLVSFKYSPLTSLPPLLRSPRIFHLPCHQDPPDSL